ncbi:taste receptor type 2 member 2-like [Ctenodactylus gundi]
MALSSLATLHMVIMSAEFFVGIIVNAFLTIVNYNHLIKSRKLTPLPILLLCIAVSRLGLQIMLVIQSVCSVFFPLDYDIYIYNTRMMCFWMFFSSVSLWFATCLSAFYCLKISSFTQPCFLWLKFRISKLTLGLLWGSFLVSVANAAACLRLDVPENEDEVLGNATLRVTVSVQSTNGFLLANLALILPLAVFVMCTCTLFISLYKHTHRMQNGPQSSSNARKEAHVNGLRTIITFFCFFVSYFAAFMANMTFKIPYRTHRFFVLKEVMAAFPAGHSIILILSNSKLQKSFRRLFCLRSKG